MSKIIYKTDEEIALIRKSNLLVSKALAHVASILKPGVTGLRLDREAEELIRDNGGIPGFLHLYDFPNTLCISPNSEVVHGIPNNIEFREGDIVSVDCGVKMNGFYGDAAYTFAIGEVGEAVERLMRVTKESLYLGIEKAIIGNRVGDISYTIQGFVEKKNRMGIVRELVGHGVGRKLHEAPEVPNFGKKGKGPLLRKGMVIAIEPMVNLGKRHILYGDDGWTITTQDGKPSAHFEHTIAVGEKKAKILSDHKVIENAIALNENLLKI